MIRYFYDPLYGKILIGQLFHPIVDSIYFRRLRHLRQLGLCYLSFPGGNHTRYEHSLGAFHLSTLMKPVIEKSDDLNNLEKSRLYALLNLGTLCHDIGHGPFSHMTENVLHGGGSNITHEDVGAAIIVHLLKEELKPFDQKFNITPEMVRQLITKSVKDDPLLKCAEELVSSDIDLDRIDYLLRDSHYCGQNSMNMHHIVNFDDIWRLSCHLGFPRFELTDEGIRYAEEILILRKNNYRRIVFESKHMGLTAMFEKAVYVAAETEDCEFGRRCKNIRDLKINLNDNNSFEEHFPKIWELYGLLDYQAISLLEECPDLDVKKIVRKIRMGECYPSATRINWNEIHYHTKKIIFSLKNEKDAFAFRRKIELELSRPFQQIETIQIAVHLQIYSRPKPIITGTVNGDLIEEISGLSKFLIDDVKTQYAVELFLDPDINPRHQDEIVKNFKIMMCEGKITF